MAAIREVDASKPERLLYAMRILELANKAYFLHVKQPPQEKVKLLRMVLSNCSIDAARIYPTYRKPFDMIFQRAKNEEWCAPGDDFRTLLRDSAASFPHTEFSDGLSLWHWGGSERSRTGIDTAWASRYSVLPWCVRRPACPADRSF
jgi:hypothetical protein